MKREEKPHSNTVRRKGRKEKQVRYTWACTQTHTHKDCEILIVTEELQGIK